ncbi:MAG: CAP domain-containing protein [Chitinophagales bacterium]
MRNKSFSFQMTLALASAAVVLALAAGPALAWSTYLGRTTTSNGTLSQWTAPAPTPAPAPAPAPTLAPTTKLAPAPSKAPTTLATTSTAGLTAQEQQLFDLVNQDRTQHGLKPLAVNADLTRLARMKAQDMVTNNYFGHISPTYGSPPDMVRAAGISYTVGVGENIVENNSIQKMYLSWINSPSHQANIVYPTFTEAGMGIVPDNYGGYIAVQLFIGR